MRKVLVAIMALLAAFGAPAAAQTGPSIPQLDPQTGLVAIPQAQATLNLDDDFVFYAPGDAKQILFDIWGNPRNREGEVLGLIMPAGMSPQSDSWGAVVTFEAIGHISADDARAIDTAALMAHLQDGVAKDNAARRQQGFETLELVGWAQEPRYDAVSHTVIWARELKFSGEAVNTLNLDLRTLGRKGVLSLNFIAEMPKLPEIRDAADSLAGQISFDPGARYEDFDSATDQSSGLGIAGLVAGGAGLAVAQKAGLLAVLLNLVKPALAVLAVLLLAAAARFRHLLGFKKSGD